ncbi:nucleoside permease [Bacillus wiedmannii]|uniref:nucleoside permease n=1 Tax=Bacillus wiedmannii TaxID=1890302 RepID=UPI000BF6664E|nr:nucleoside permease [Bacillus wiedmannii]PEU21536.1 nucleoside permease [Bacillus wiedmannii]
MVLNRWLTEEERARAAANGIGTRTLYYRLYRSDKWELEEALTAPPGTVRHNYKGKYAKWLATAAENGIGRETFYSRLNGGWSYNDAATKPIKRRNKLAEKWFDIAKQNGVGYQTFMSRINTRKWDAEKAATTPTIRTGRNCPVQVKEEVL